MMMDDVILHTVLFSSISVVWVVIKGCVQWTCFTIEEISTSGTWTQNSGLLGQQARPSAIELPGLLKVKNIKENNILLLHVLINSYILIDM